MDEKTLEARRKYQREYYAMHPEARKKRDEYMRKWRSKPENKEKQKKYMENFWKRKAEEMGL